MNILFIQLGMYDFGVKYKFLFMRDAKVGERAAALFAKGIIKEQTDVNSFQNDTHFLVDNSFTFTAF